VAELLIQTQQTPVGTPVFLLIFLVLAAYAVAGSDRKLRTFGIILLSAGIGLGIGAGIGLAIGNAAAGGKIAAGLLIVAGAAASIRQILDNRSRHKKYKL
jgi:hypothetical protein